MIAEKTTGLGPGPNPMERQRDYRGRPWATQLSTSWMSSGESDE